MKKDVLKFALFYRLDKLTRSKLTMNSSTVASDADTMDGRVDTGRGGVPVQVS